jgi:hypothetical protein
VLIACEDVLGIDEEEGEGGSEGQKYRTLELNPLREVGRGIRQH